MMCIPLKIFLHISHQIMSISWSVPDTSYLYALPFFWESVSVACSSTVTALPTYLRHCWVTVMYEVSITWRVGFSPQELLCQVFRKKNIILTLNYLLIKELSLSFIHILYLFLHTFMLCFCCITALSKAQYHLSVYAP